jgi:glutathione S-transferase
VLEVGGRTLAQSNAILGFIGRSYGLHPSDPWEAAKHEALMNVCEELRHVVGRTLTIKDPEEKKTDRPSRGAIAG